MPSVVSNQNNYYASRQRRLSQSQTSLPDQMRYTRVEPQDPNRSLIFLPSTAYSQSDNERSRATSLSVMNHDTLTNESDQYNRSIYNPDDFYRQRHVSDMSVPQASADGMEMPLMEDNNTNSSAQGRKPSFTSTRSLEDTTLRRSKRPTNANMASAIHGTSLDNRIQDTSKSIRSTSNPPRLRQASFKDLVARFDTLPDNAPPAPSQSLSRVNSFSISPIAYTNSQHFGQSKTNHDHSQRKQGLVSPDEYDSPTALLYKSVSEIRSINDENESGRKRPLFGEVPPGQISINVAGYGISRARRRRGSEGSPMHTPTAMFTAPDETPRASVFPTALSEHSASNERSLGLPGTINLARQHRAYSDLTRPPEVLGQDRMNADGFESTPSYRKGHARWASTSHIDAEGRNENRSNATRNLIQPRSDAADDQKHNNTPRALKQREVSTSTGSSTQANARRKPVSLNHIQSPGRQGRNIVKSQGEKSPSLRANIIAPPPKISPPLRSSRPRLPVSAATTAASRAKMAEKFQLMAREQSERKHSTRRSRPPELTDVDLKARRLKITQALSRSREGQDLRSDPSFFPQTSASERASIAASASDIEDVTSDLSVVEPEIPDVLIESSLHTMNASLDSTKEFQSPEPQNDDQHGVSQRHTPHMASRSLNSPYVPTDQSLENRHRRHHSSDHTSAYNMTAGKRSIADELARTVHRFSTHGQVTKLQAPNSPFPQPVHSNSEELSSERGDEESIHIMLRDTTYMDEDEAVVKGYHAFNPQPGRLDLPNTSIDNRDSWTSSIAESIDVIHQKNNDGDYDDNSSDIRQEAIPDEPISLAVNKGRPESSAYSCNSDLNEDSTRNTMASDAYTLVNIVLQQRSASGVVNQQLVDDIYHRIMAEEPHLIDSDEVDALRVEELCLKELKEYEDILTSTVGRGSSLSMREDSPSGESRNASVSNNLQNTLEVIRPPSVTSIDLLPPKAFRTHRYKSSLDSVEDWAETSPSVGDWMKFALSENPDQVIAKESSPLTRSVRRGDATVHTEDRRAGQTISQDIDDQKVVSVLANDDPQFSPLESPPPRPISKSPSREQTLPSAKRTSQGSTFERPVIPVRTTSSSNRPRKDRPTSTYDPSTEQSFAEDQSSRDMQRGKQRRHVLKELVDTEYSYERDLRVLCDIYMQTAVAALSDDDIKTLFGNIEQVQQFSKDFLFLLKQVVKPAYVMERPDRTRDQDRTAGIQTTDNVTVPVSQPGVPESSDVERDHQTRVGQAFEASLSAMELVYTEYIRGRHLGNKRLEQLQGMPGVREWLRECSSNSNDITNAWSLDALLVKPIQRITKYPLLLNQLLESTAPDHPDYLSLRHALLEVTEINVRINEVKKHTELVDQVLNRKRKESDVRNGLTKAFGRRAEKLRQHVGINEMYEDAEYARLRMDFDNNGVHLLIVSKDCQGYVDAIKAWVSRMCGLALAAEAWVDVGHTSHAEAESKLRQLAMAVRGISSIALPDHSDQVWKKIIRPMERANAMMDRFKNDPKGLIQKREKKLLDYGQARNKRDRGEKLDKRMIERMEQWEALNLEAKKRMKKLLQSTAVLVQSCLKSLIQLHLSWLALCNEKFSSAMAIPLNKLGDIDLVKEWQVDYDFQEASALALGICNGSLLAEAVNMVSFLTPGSTLAGDESPRQVSWNSVNKRSISLHSEGSRIPTSDLPFRVSQDYHRENSLPQLSSSQLRTTSIASSITSRTPERFQNTNGYMPQLASSSINLPRTTTASRQSDETSLHAPRLSLDTPSPSIGPLGPDSPFQRPSSGSTFFSAVPVPTRDPLDHVSTGSSIFSSAMPMSDSPVNGQTPGIVAGDEPPVLFAVASVNEFNIDRSRQEGGIPYLTYVTGEIFDVIGERGELWLARNQDDPTRLVGWIWNKHFAKLAE